MKALDKFLDNAMRFLMAIAMGSLVVGGTWQIFTRGCREILNFNPYRTK